MSLELREQVDNYVESKKFAWSQATVRSERSRLMALVDLVDVEPSAVYTKLKERYKPYTTKTQFIRLGEFYNWLIKQGLRGPANPFKNFLEEYRNLFKHVYEKERLNVTYQEATQLIDRLECRESKEKAKALLTSGLRWAESRTQADGWVLGKGGKRRRVYGPSVEYRLSYSTFRSRLAAIGLKPHTLRKLAATRLAEAGARPQDLMEVFGWSSMETAGKYLQAQRERELEALVTKAFENK